MSPVAFIYLIWGLWFVAWIIAAVMDRREAGALAGWQSVAFHLAMAVAIAFLLTIAKPWPATDLQNQLWTRGVPDTLGWVLVGVAFAGFALSGWASVHRIHHQRHGDSVVDSGPYAAVRHPVYLGLMIAAAATAVSLGQPTAFVGAVLVIIALVAKVFLEERNADDPMHAAYRRRVPMFVPFLPTED